MNKIKHATEEITSWILVFFIMLMPIIILLVMVFWQELGGTYTENLRETDSIPYQGM